jgi:hypothetical protein
MKKAIPSGMAPFAPHTLSGFLREPMPASEGFAFNWGPYFDGMHSRIPEGTDGDAGPQTDNSGVAEFFKVLPSARSGHRWSAGGRHEGEGPANSVIASDERPVPVVVTALATAGAVGNSGIVGQGNALR